MQINSPVTVDRCDSYTPEVIRKTVRRQFASLGIDENMIRGKNVVLKPNLLLGCHPDKAATTHPAVVEGVVLLLQEMKPRQLLLAESPGGPYHTALLRGIYSTCGMTDVAKRTGMLLNSDLTAIDVPCPDGSASKAFHLLTPLCKADIIINLCKLKTHSLAAMTCAAKNLFGAIPGIEKFEMHARFPEPPAFFNMLTDLNLAVDALCPVLHICDAVVGMEGNGPSGGTPRKIGCLLASRNPFNLDLLASSLIGLEGEVPMLEIAARRGLCPSDFRMLTLLGDKPEDFQISGFRRADATVKSKFDRVPDFMRPRPLIDRSLCVGCGTCVRSCPEKAISLRDKRAFIRKDACIRCFCCQELCTFRAVKIKKSVILRLIQPERTAKY